MFSSKSKLLKFSGGTLALFLALSAFAAEDDYIRPCVNCESLEFPQVLISNHHKGKSNHHKKWHHFHRIYSSGSCFEENPCATLYLKPGPLDEGY